MGRLFAQPKKLRVEADAAGAPTRLYWRGRWEAVRVASRWRIEDDWWRPGGEVARDYYKVWLVSAMVGVVYRDALTGEWYLEKVLD